jgi:hypothetical protein
LRTAPLPGAMRLKQIAGGLAPMPGLKVETIGRGRITLTINLS